MSERPIIFSAPMVRAILAGRKTQTRRLATSPLAKAQPGDRLWVRETWAEVGGGDPGDLIFRATYEEDCARHGFDRCNLPPADKAPWRPSIHMPRRVCRLLLDVTGVRRERLQAIPPKDAEAEGVFRHVAEHSLDKVFRSERPTAAVDYFRKLWNSLHAKPGTTWADNPEVVAITFRRLP